MRTDVLNMEITQVEMNFITRCGDGLHRFQDSQGYIERPCVK